MKQVTITTGKATIVVIENAETIFKGISVGDHIIFNKTVFPLLPDDLHNEDDIYELIGEPTNLYEEDWKGIVDSLPDLRNHELRRYRDYTKEHRFPKDAYLFRTATESGLSLLKANGVVMDNCFGKEHPERTTQTNSEYLNQSLSWSLEQDNLWLNPQIFVKV